MANRDEHSFSQLSGERESRWKWIWLFTAVVVLALAGLLYSLRDRWAPVIEKKQAATPVVTRREVMITDFDGKMDVGGGGFTYAGPEGESVDYSATALEPNDPLDYQGRSLKITWSLKGKQFCGWGVGKLAGDRAFDISNADSLEMELMGQNGGEEFDVKLKDLSGVEKGVQLKRYYLLPKGHWTAVQIPLKEFTGVNLKAIENINFGFNAGLSGEAGSLLVDNIKIIYKEIK